MGELAENWGWGQVPGEVGCELPGDEWRWTSENHMPNQESMPSRECCHVQSTTTRLAGDSSRNRRDPRRMCPGLKPVPFVSGEASSVKPWPMETNHHPFEGFGSKAS